MGVQTGFCEDGRKSTCPIPRMSVKRASTVSGISCIGKENQSYTR